MFSSDNDLIRKKTVLMINKYIKNLTKSKVIEKSIYNYMVNYSNTHHIKKTWANKKFYNLY